MPVLPRLRTRTVVAEDPGNLILHTDPWHPVVWLRRGEGLAASGTAWEGRFRGSSRVPDAGVAWSELVAAAEIDDDVQVPGSGLVGFAAFAFDDHSRAASVLRVPRTVVGRRDGACFVTTITADGAEPSRPTLGAQAPLGVDARTRFREGAMTASAHTHAITHAVDLIREGVLTKVVIARDLDGRLAAGADRRHVLTRLADSYSDCWTYAVDGLVGASPEMLVRVLGGQVSARVLAGTTRRGRTPQEDASLEHDLRRNPKDRIEHRLAIDSAIAQLASLDDHDEPETGLTVSPEPFALALPNVWHLASDIRGALPQGRTVLDLVHALHPTAAVGGTPTGVAVETIRRLERYDRRRYAGPVGWLDWRGDGEFAVALRGAEIDDDGRVTAFAGGGIVADSNPMEEFAETELKFRPITQALGDDTERDAPPRLGPR
ncbi:isochorismate synthase [Pseudoclavibacter endophyticus]|uniref:isochorismate synthase n=1 Tax=Pseudoclavibacter endophyticus TaxID=1778590 RepID=A0A6H9WBK2_9MICO|nr:isochorismate synthase [Pseudoclavibacter endophyticus]KAB1648030.1 isochorismate synthase [Pseudoclavibacter endophyticus]